MNKPKKDLNNETVIVFGATGGLGDPLCHELYDAGANLVLVARTKEKLEKLKDSFKDNLGTNQVMIFPADASNIEPVRRAFKAGKKRFRKIHGVIISVGTHEPISIKNTPEEILCSTQRLFHSMVEPVVAVASVAQEVFRKQKSGVIIHISSHVVKDRSLSGNDTYRLAKSAASSFIIDIAEELRPYRVKAIDIQPGTINTPNAPYLKTTKARASAIDPRKIAKWIISHFHDPNLVREKLFKSKVKF